MLPRRFALIRHVDYTGAAGTGVIAYGVAFDDGQVVLRWSSAHRATSVLDSVEDLIAAHGHGEATSIEWIDAPPGTAESPAQQGGRRARRAAPPNDTCSTGDVPLQEPAETTPAEARPAAQAAPPSTPAQGEDARPAAHVHQSAAPAETADVRPAAHVPQSATPAETADVRPAAQLPHPPTQAADVRPAAQAPQAPTAPAPPGHTTAPLPKVPAAAAQPTAPPPAKPAAAQPTASTSVWGSGKSAFEPAAQPGSAPDSNADQPAHSAPSGHESSPAPEAPPTPTPAARPFPTPTSGTTGTPKPAERAQAPFSGTTLPPSADKTPSWTDDTSRGNRSGGRRPSDDDADVLDHPAAARSADDERRSRHAAIATQPMNADLPEDRGPRRPRRAAPTHESPRSIFDEAEDPPRPDLRLASSNGRSRDHDDPEASDDGSAGRDEFGGFFSTGHQHLDTVTGLLDLPASLNRRGRGAGTDQDATASRRNGRHRGE